MPHVRLLCHKIKGVEVYITNKLNFIFHAMQITYKHNEKNSHIKRDQ